MLRLEFLLTLLGLTYASSNNEPFYRKDYKYVADFYSFYKLHNTSSEWTDAFLTCTEEGSKLFYPKDSTELTVLKNLPMENIIEVLVGVHDEFNVGEYITLDDSGAPFTILGSERTSDSSQCVLLNVETGKYALEACSQSRPFICKKQIQPPRCRTIDTDYIYSERTDKCYKINHKQRNWTEAFKTCYMEGASLLVVKDVEEYGIVTELVGQATRRNRDSSTYFMGVHRLNHGGDLYTVKGKLFDDHFYQKLDDCNGYYTGYQPHEDCLGFVYNSCYRSIPCNSKTGFVCEINANR